MNDIKFNCPQCGQHLTVPPSGANLTVACPNCGQAIVVPPLARAVVTPDKPKQALWPWIAAGIVIIALLAGGALLWQFHSSASRLTPEALSEKQFLFRTETPKGHLYHGFIKLQSDGKLSGSGVHDRNEASWSIDEQGRLIFKHQDGRVSTIFINALRQHGKWHFSGPFQFAQGFTNSLEEVSPETVANEKWLNPLEAALCDLQNNHDADTANFVSNILVSVEKPGGSTSEALAADTDRINNKVRQLVQQGALENAATLQDDALYDIIYAESSIPPGPSNPPNPNHKTGGKPGPGGLVLYLPFDKLADADGTVHDESGAGNDGKVFGAQWVPDGKFGGAYQFHITNLTDRIVIPNSDTLNPDTITVSAWVKTPVNLGFYSRIVDKDCRNAYCLDLAGDWKGIARRGKSGQPGLETSRGLCYGDRSLGDNRWHHIAATYDGRIVCFYTDGVERSRQVRNPGPLKKSSYDLCIGNSVVDYGTGEFLAFDGLIDEVRIYNRALSPQEIQALAWASQPGVDAISPEAQAKARRVKPLTDALPALSGDDPASACLVSNILTSFDQPEGLTSNACVLDMERMKGRVRELVRSGAMKSAAILNRAQVDAFWSDSPQQPAEPSHKTGGAPGPGGLVLYFPFDAPATNGMVQDESGAGNDGQVFGAEWVPDGKFGGAYRFSITNFDDRIVVPNSDSLNPEHITVAAWVKSSSSSGFWRRIIDKDCWHGYCLSLAGSGRDEGKAWFEGQVPWGGIPSGRVLDDNQWHHVAVTYDGQMVRCYIDGVENGKSQVWHPRPLQPDDWDLCIGNSVPDFGGELLSFDGLIDEVRIYNRALSADEIMSLATANHAGADILPSSAQTGTTADTAERLKQVKELYDQGLITKDQYDQKVKEIMNSL